MKWRHPDLLVASSILPLGSGSVLALPDDSRARLPGAELLARRENQGDCCIMLSGETVGSTTSGTPRL